MATPLRVLIVEDQPADAELLVNELYRAGFEPDWQRVDLEADYVAHLEPDLDVILTDHSLPQFSAFDVLRHLSERQHDIPCIVVTGTLSDEEAVESLKQGAADYLLKDRLGRLGAAVRRAIQERHLRREMRQAETIRRESEARYRIRASQQAAVAQLGQRALAANETASVVERAVKLVADTLGVKYSVVLELLPDGATLQPGPGVGWPPGSADDTVVAGASSQAGHAISSGNPIVVYDLATETRFSAPVLLHTYGVVSCITVVIRGVNGPFGVLCAYSTVHRIFSEDDVHFLQVVANVLSAAIQRQQAAEALQKSEERLRQSQKMEAVGMLAGGIAHDFNNLLTAIIGFNSLVLDQMPADDPKIPFLQEIATAGERAATLTRQLLTFSRQEVQELERLDLNAVVTDIEKLLRRVIGEDIDLASVLDLRLGQVHADRGQIEQIIMNLAVNARDAMPTGGKITITTSNVDLENTGEAGTSDDSRYVMLAVSDTGAGMDAATQARIFEPFFTTKEMGKGTGLGLSTVYGIVTQSKGDIQVHSEPGLGTTFRVYLPRVDQSEVDETPSATLTRLMEGSEFVLLVEDEAGVRSLAGTVLELAGYRVLRAGGPEEALALCRSSVEPLDLLITDVVMPGMNGAELARQVVELWPGAKVLFISGYPGEVAVRHGVLNTGSGYLAKPFTPSEIGRKVREVLDESPGVRGDR